MSQLDRRLLWTNARVLCQASPHEMCGAQIEWGETLLHAHRFCVLPMVDGFGGLVAGLWFPSSRVRTQPKSLDFFRCEKILSMSSFGGEVK
jgi:hypothetical protein